LKSISNLKEMREKEDSELLYDSQQIQQELFDLRFKSSAEGLSNPSRIREIRRQVARIKTLLVEREKSIRGAIPRK